MLPSKTTNSGADFDPNGQNGQNLGFGPITGLNTIFLIFGSKIPSPQFFWKKSTFGP